MRVLFFGKLKEIVGRAEDSPELATANRVQDVFEHYAERFPEFGRFRASIAAAVNQQYAEFSAPLHANDEIAFLPPVSGGSQAAVDSQSRGDICEITRSPLRAEISAAEVKAGADGAVVLFDGIVRNNFKGRETQYLIYEAYEPMALAKMREICAEVHLRFAIDRVVMRHRLGRLEIGETSIVIAVSAAHRAAAFDACRFAIDTFKRTVPIWKKEFFRDGAVWAEGEVPGLQPFVPPDSSIA
ncbi:MAG TPA: molybdopterin converting factor subunit 1 [Candidatus Acidoferrales bacterium]|nr:molybdopterin converting factor subunit 1 [Candidatus Acidoferrales bacterium]